MTKNYHATAKGEIVDQQLSDIGLLFNIRPVSKIIRKCIELVHEKHVE